MLKNPFIKDSATNQYQTLINQINALENNLKTLTDTELRNKTFQLKKQYKEEKDLNSLIAESFAITREASFRTLGLRHFDVQLIGGLVLNSGKISEMRTGEGKTLVATLPAYLNALTDKGVHIVTVNDYLASRDQISMGQIYRFLGLDTGLIQEDMNFRERQENYKADITYVTNNEVAFDYLRDNMASNLNQVVLPPFNYCIVDEVDSIFIDEAQVPLIISQAVETCIDKYIVAAEVAEYLEVNVHFKVDEKNRNIILTEQGTAQIEKILQVEDLYNPNDPWIPYILSHFITHEGMTAPSFPYLCLTVSGGHTQIVVVHNAMNMEIIGKTIDDAAGEAFDKAAKMLGLPYPGGPLIDHYGKTGNPMAFTFAEPNIPELNFSFSGLKTSILYFLQKEVAKDPDFVALNLNDLCASIQHRITEILLKKLKKAQLQTGITCVAVSGGVSVNSGLRAKLQAWKVTNPELSMHIAIPSYCTDNAAMIAITGAFLLEAGITHDQQISANAKLPW